MILWQITVKTGFKSNVNLSKRVGMDRDFLQLTGLLLGISLGAALSKHGNPRLFLLFYPINPKLDHPWHPMPHRLDNSMHLLLFDTPPLLQM